MTKSNFAIFSFLALALSAPLHANHNPAIVTINNSIATEFPITYAYTLQNDHKGSGKEGSGAIESGAKKTIDVSFGKGSKNLQKLVKLSIFKEDRALILSKKLLYAGLVYVNPGESVTIKCVTSNLGDGCYRESTIVKESEAKAVSHE